MSKMRVLLKSFDYKLIDKVALEIYDKVKKMVKGKVIGPVPLPTKRVIITVLNSPHIDRKSKDTFAKQEHRRFIEFPVSNLITTELSKIDFAPEVDSEVKVID